MFAFVSMLLTAFLSFSNTSFPFGIPLIISVGVVVSELIIVIVPHSLQQQDDWYATSFTRINSKLSILSQHKPDCFSMYEFVITYFTFPHHSWKEPQQVGPPSNITTSCCHVCFLRSKITVDGCLQLEKLYEDGSSLYLLTSTKEWRKELMNERTNER